MRILFDLEGDDLLFGITRLWCGVFKDIDTREVYKFTPDTLKEIPEFLSQVTMLGAHNLIGFDLPALLKLGYVDDYSIKHKTLNGKPCKFVDTLLLSKLFNPDRPGGHSIAAWGERFSSPKGDWKDFSRYDPSMLAYCERDVEILEKIFNALIEEL